ncbi:DNA polymerase iota, partial [Madurella mycetomatis]
CVENRQPSLKTLPLGIKQKGILATCNYVARRYGVKKLMPIVEAKKLCPDLVIADGEDLSPFRDVSKRLYSLLRSYSWNAKIERLGLDEMFLDVTDIVSYNVEVLNMNSLRQSYFCLSRSDPEAGFGFDATYFAGCIHGRDEGPFDDNVLRMRLLLASHLAQYLRLKIEEQGYTTACGISTSKLLAKLVGDKNKPRNQTTLLALSQEDTLSFMDEHKLRKVPGIGSKITRILEGVVLGKEPNPDIYSMECSATVGQVRLHPSISPPALEKLFSGSGSERGLGNKVWALLHGVDDIEVKPARDVPTQISIEDSYKGLNEPYEIRRALLAVTASLLRRMHTDLLVDDDSPSEAITTPNLPTTSKKWRAYPKTIRLSTRPYTSPVDNKPYDWARASRSCPLPGFVFHNSSSNPGLSSSSFIDRTAERLVAETLLPLFYKLNPDKRGWNIGLINICVANMTGTDCGVASGRDIATMFRRQEGVLREFRVYDDNPSHREQGQGIGSREKDNPEALASDGQPDEEDHDSDTWDHDTRDQDQDMERCPLCGHLIPRFAVLAHERYHSMGEGL